MVTHFPLVGIVFALLINIYAVVRKNPEVLKLSLWVYVLVGVSALIAYLTGDGAEEIIKSYPGITEDLTESHEHFALAFLIGALVAACISLYGLFISSTKEKVFLKITRIMMILTAVICILAIETAVTGGNIRHSEIEKGVYKEVK